MLILVLFWDALRQRVLMIEEDGQRRFPALQREPREPDATCLARICRTLGVYPYSYLPLADYPGIAPWTLYQKTPYLITFWRGRIPEQALTPGKEALVWADPRKVAKGTRDEATLDVARAMNSALFPPVRRERYFQEDDLLEVASD